MTGRVFGNPEKKPKHPFLTEDLLMEKPSGSFAFLRRLHTAAGFSHQLPRTTPQRDARQAILDTYNDIRYNRD